MAILSALRHLRYRPSLLTAAAVGIVAGFVGHRFMPQVSALLLGWSSGVIIYIGLILRIAGRADVGDIRRRAERLDEGAGLILVITVGAALASLGAIVAELASGKSGHRGLSFALAGITVVLSWMFVHTVFAFHYAHEYYGGDADTGAAAKCLVFPGETQPLYWDFLYFSFVIGMTAQVSDVTTQSPDVRKMVLVHGIISFFFNTAILALGVNLAAGLVG